MDDRERQSAYMSALTTEHFVLQTGANATVNEAGTRTSLYILALFSALVAMGFAAQSREVFVPFVATVLPTLFLLGLFTVVRLVDAAIGVQLCPHRHRPHPRLLPRAHPRSCCVLCARARALVGDGKEPTLRFGEFIAFTTTIASMVTFINSFVAGAASPCSRTTSSAVPRRDGR